MEYYIFIEDGKVNGCGQAQRLDDNVINYEVEEDFYNKFEQNPSMYIWDGLQVVGNPNYEEEQAQKEKERIQELFMTRSDFFDGTIQAWGVGQAELLVLVQTILAPLPIEDVKKKIALNNFQNALNFYRKHDLFKMLVNVPITLKEGVQVILTDESLDKFFDEVDKGNKDTAWQHLPHPVMVIEEEPVEEEVTEG